MIVYCITLDLLPFLMVELNWEIHSLILWHNHYKYQSNRSAASCCFRNLVCSDDKRVRLQLGLQLILCLCIPIQREQVQVLYTIIIIIHERTYNCTLGSPDDFHYMLCVMSQRGLRHYNHLYYLHSV